MSPVSYRSVQHPLSQSSALVQGVMQTNDVEDRRTQVKPSQHSVALQLLSSTAHRPASALGLWQVSQVSPASPVQKQEASSKVMHVNAAQ